MSEVKTSAGEVSNTVLVQSIGMHEFKIEPQELRAVEEKGWNNILKAFSKGDHVAIAEEIRSLYIEGVIKGMQLTGATNITARIDDV
jgi:hypothetical protein